MGPDLMTDLQKQAERFGTDTRYGLATSVDFSLYPFRVTIDESNVLEARSVIIATGASARWLGLPSEQRLNGRGVSACAVCDGFFFKGMDVAVVGGGDSAAEEASYLSKICSKVYLIVRRDELRASKIMQKRIFSNPKIEVVWNSVPEEIVGDSEVDGVRVRNKATNEAKVIPVKGFFVAIGHTPNTEIFKNFLDLDENGYIKTVPGSTRTNIEGIFAAGDVQDHIYRQAVTAAGSGCMAALDAEKFLAQKEMEVSA
jgi:thioredoxin reductase (NADPH)